MEGMTTEVITAIAGETGLTRGVVVGAHAFLYSEMEVRPTPADVLAYLVVAGREGFADPEGAVEHAVDPPRDRG